MATNSNRNYRQSKQHGTNPRAEYDDGSDMLEGIEGLIDKMTLIDRWMGYEADNVERYIKSYKNMKDRCADDIMQCKFDLMKLLRKQEEKTKEIRKLNVVIYEAEGEDIKRTDEECKLRVERLIRLATNTHIPVQWATQLDECLPGMTVTRVRFFTEVDKTMFLAGEDNLVGKGIYIDHDLTSNQLKVQKNLEDFAAEERAAGRTAVVGIGTVCIDGILHTAV